MLVLRVDVDSQRLAVPVGVEIAVLVDRRQCPLEHVAVPLVVLTRLGKKALVGGEVGQLVSPRLMSVGGGGIAVGVVLGWNRLVGVALSGDASETERRTQMTVELEQPRSVLAELLGVTQLVAQHGREPAKRPVGDGPEQREAMDSVRLMKALLADAAQDLVRQVVPVRRQVGGLNAREIMLTVDDEEDGRGVGDGRRRQELSPGRGDPLPFELDAKTVAAGVPLSRLIDAGDSAVADRYPADLPVADAKAGSGRVCALTCRDSANPIHARSRGEVQVPPAYPDMQAGAGMKAAPRGLDVVDPLRELIVEPVRDEQAATKVREDAPTQALAWSEGSSDTGARLAEGNRPDRTAENDDSLLRQR